MATPFPEHFPGVTVIFDSHSRHGYGIVLGRGCRALMDLRDDFQAWWGGVVGLLLCMIDYFMVSV